MSVIPPNRPTWLPLPTNAVQNLADILLEGCGVRGRKPKIDEKNLILPSKAVKWNSIRMRTQKLTKALLSYSAVLRFEPPAFSPTTNLPGGHMKTGCKSVGRENRKSMNFFHFIIEPCNLRTDGFHGVTSASCDGFYSCVRPESTQQGSGLRFCPRVRSSWAWLLALPCCRDPQLSHTVFNRFANAVRSGRRLRWTVLLDFAPHYTFRLRSAQFLAQINKKSVGLRSPFIITCTLWSAGLGR